MPELPEVETLKSELSRKLRNKKIKNIEVRAPKLAAPLSVKKFIKLTEGRKIKSVNRRGKIIDITLDKNLSLLIHLKMTGQLIYQPKLGKMIVGGHPQKGGVDNLPNNYTRAIFYFTDKSVLYFNDLRKFGWIKLATREEKEGIFELLGHEPLNDNFSFESFDNLIQKYPNRKIKQLLLDQKLIAGLGNIYVDESCFSAGILPTRQVKDIKRNERKKLHKAIIDVLKLSIKMKGTSAKNYVRSDGTAGGFVPYLNVYGRKNHLCKKCKTPIEKIKLHGRGTHFCPKCQK